ncbi:ABC transporter ATP-binding protein [Desulfofustis glycolicus]|uniref:ABC-type bacteriocin/lantibiotic exporter, contains an N-terminal double-glycine peptidase domain n=1 Tax=Desulfofustis glycolicus DSM 9705 TaxID=1121409 RepID=A0A1M5WIB2_9BACT|nr:ABC transporter ATP-binding protein [Desulfofustis glycolicus]MCB2216842.1 ABC transporter ATP-binding protein/permease [Desulfobulbaceae bacterium]SHH87157.1 ABC-type bacteriocin/lantibiotic exporter, contains an N-terminal double-glycine peptidase domain [Desulfofustis glycolicus DSM 9705]
MFDIVRKVLLLLDRKEKKQLLVLFLLLSFSSLIEVAGIGSIMPFIAIVTNSEIIAENSYLEAVYRFFNFTSHNHFIIFVGCGVFLLLIVTNASNALITWLIYHYSWMRNYSISKRMLEKYIYLPYEFFLMRNTSDLRKNIIEEVRMVVNGVLLQLLTVAKNIVFSVVVVLMIFYVDPLLALTITLVLGGAYGVLFGIIYRKLKKSGKVRSKSNRMRFKVAEEAFNSIKSLKILGREQFFVDAFDRHSLKLSKSQAYKNIVSQIPKYLFEVLILGTIMLIILYFLVAEKEIDYLLPTMSLYAFAAYRLMPAMQRLFAGISDIRFSTMALDNVFNDMSDLKEKGGFRVIAHEDNCEKLRLKESINVHIGSFRYTGQTEKLFSDVSLTIGVNTTVGFIGSTGAGKTTLIDIILGLLSLEDGWLKIDGHRVERNDMRKWQRNIGYVPQDIFLVDDSVKKNIALGIDDSAIDHNRVIQAAKTAKIHDFIVAHLPDGYDSTVGERGVRLSGGQRQRLGLARSLYHEPQVLVFDEATSALDNLTEKQVMEAIQELAGKKTILMIAHRLSTLRECDVIYVLDRGRIVSSGTYTDLLENCDIVRNMHQTQGVTS